MGGLLATTAPSQPWPNRPVYGACGSSMGASDAKTTSAVHPAFERTAPASCSVAARELARRGVRCRTDMGSIMA
jgi:hypothetical protein